MVVVWLYAASVVGGVLKSPSLVNAALNAVA